MLARIPVYSDENNLHHISIFLEESDGTFKRTQSEPLRLLRDNIDGISTAQGEIISHKFDKNERSWKSPTVTFHYGRPQSVYQFLREKLAQNKFYVFTKPNLTGRIIQFSLHELRLKRSTSQQILKLLKEKYTEAVDVWSKDQYLYYVNNRKPAGVGIKAKRQRLLEKKRRAVQQLKEGQRHAGIEKEQIFVRYNRHSLDPGLELAKEMDNQATTPVFSLKKSKKIGKPKDEDGKDKDGKLLQRFQFLLD